MLFLGLAEVAGDDCTSVISRHREIGFVTPVLFLTSRISYTFLGHVKDLDRMDVIEFEFGQVDPFY